MGYASTAGRRDDGYEPRRERSALGRRDFLRRVGLAAGGTLLLEACRGADTSRDTGVTGPSSSQQQCLVDEDQIFSFGASSGGIPALTNPDVVPPGGAGLDFLSDETRVVGVELGGAALAVPFNILWWHEVVNFDRGEDHVAVTRCPLTGSSRCFLRDAIGDRPYAVSGLVFLSNLMLSTGDEQPTLIPQMAGRAACGPRSGLVLATWPSVETRWSRWRELHPDTVVVSSRTGWNRNYSFFPYNSDYPDPDNPDTVVPVPQLDPRRPPKEVVLGVPSGGGAQVPGKTRGSGLAFPFGELATKGSLAAVEATVDAVRMVVLWERASRTATAVLPKVTGLASDDPNEGRSVTLGVEGGEIRDAETDSTWRVDGRATAGPLAGARLEPVSRAYTAFWFAWALFQPETKIWEAGG